MVFTIYMRNALAFEAFSETHQIAAKIKDFYFYFSPIVCQKFSRITQRTK